MIKRKILILCYLKLVFNIFCENIEIYDNFKYCHLNSHQKPINTRQICLNDLSSHKNVLLDIGIQLNKTFVELVVLSRNDHNVMGISYECEMYSHIRSFHTGWTLKKSHKDSDIEIIKLNEAECRNMIKTHKCGGDDMNCDKDGCKFMNEPSFNEDNWSYFTTVDPTITFKTCRVTFKELISHSIDDQIFSHNCIVKDFFCELDSSIIVWDKNVINQCPFEKIKVLNMKLDDFSFIDEKENILFEYLEPETICSIPSIKTVENLNLITIEALNIISSKLINMHEKNDFQIFNRFSMAERDFNQYKIMKKERKFTMYECNAYIEFMESKKHLKNHFFVKNDLNLNERIFYVKSNQIYIPICVNINKITVNSTFIIENHKCDIYPIVTFDFSLNTVIHFGFLHSHGIISPYREVSECPEESLYIDLPNKEKYLLKTQNKYSLIESNKANLQRLDISNFKTSKIELKHSNILLKKLEAGQFNLAIHYSNKIIENHPLYKLEQGSVFYDIYKIGHDLFLKISTIWTLFSISIIIIPVFLIVILIKCKCCNFLCLKKCFCTKQIIENNTENHEQIELQTNLFQDNTEY